ncbi:MAG: hypothetical protein LIO37_05335, partial [Clostridiales bacterium]|nr:hypothetical protein [Clostridiales bacterium]
MNQVVSNYLDTRRLAEENSATESALCQTIMDAAQRMKTSESQYDQLKTRIRQSEKQCMSLVDQNKHFTSPTKRISEGLSGMLAQQREQSRQCDRLLQMVGDLETQADAAQAVVGGAKLTAEAGRLENQASEIKNELETMQQKNAQTEQRITELSEQVRYLVGLLRENNVSMSQLLKEQQGTVSAVEKYAIPPYSGEALEWREQVLGLRNTDEEILKLQERNRIQLEDIGEEIQTQNRAEKEIKETITPIFEEARNYFNK